MASSDQNQIIILKSSTTSSDQIIVEISDDDGCVFSISKKEAGTESALVEDFGGTKAAVLYDIISEAVEKLSTRPKGSTIEITIPNEKEDNKTLDMVVYDKDGQAVDMTLDMVLYHLGGRPAAGNKEEAMKKYLFLAGRIPFDGEEMDAKNSKVVVVVWAKKAWETLVSLFCINSLIRN